MFKTIQNLKTLICDIFENPVVLRDIGWLYSRPFLGFIPRKAAQIFIAIAFAGIFYAAWIYGWVKSGFDEDTVLQLLLIFSAFIAFAMILLSAVSTISAWKRDKDRYHLVDLIMTGMDLRVLAHGKILARGFPLFSVITFVVLHLLASMIWIGFDFFLHFITDPFQSIGNYFFDDQLGFLMLTSVCMVYLLSAVLIYIEGLRIMLLGKLVIVRYLTVIFKWMGFFPLLWIFMSFLFAYVNFELVSSNIDDLLLQYFCLYLMITGPLVYLFQVLIQYRRLMHTIEHHFNNQLNEGD